MGTEGGREGQTDRGREGQTDRQRERRREVGIDRGRGDRQTEIGREGGARTYTIA